MPLAHTLDRLHARVKANRWFRYFAVFNRMALAAGFIPSGLTKVLGERFTSLAINHPMGNYLEALYHTGYYYTFIGYAQVTAALLLLFPRTATLGALLYFPIILNICILSLAVGFDGSLISAPLMVYTNLYLLCWDYDKLKWIFPFSGAPLPLPGDPVTKESTQFPKTFFLGVAATIGLTILVLVHAYEKRTRNTFTECMEDCRESDNSTPCFDFCDCIHKQSHSFDHCTEALKAARKNP
jgi:uncharacterized membrane protein YphA (DoxX/SURF4 family)